MTNETTIREKGRAVFLAALMVMSVFAMSAAFAGSAAADEHLNVDITDFDESVEEGEDLNVDVTVSDEEDAEQEDVDVALEADDGTELDSATVTIAAEDDEQLTLTWETESGDADEDITLTVTADGDVSESVDVTVTEDEAEEEVEPDADEVFDDPEQIEDIWVGQEIAVGDLEDADGAEIRQGFSSDDGNTVETSAIDDNGFATFDTDELEDDEPYHLVVHGDSEYDENYGFWAYEMNFEVESPNTVSQVSETSFEFDSDRDDDDYDVIVSSDNLSEDELGEIFNTEETSSDDETATIEDIGNDEIDADFDNVDVGDYNISFDVADAVDSDEVSVTVTDEDIDYAFVDVDQPAQGEIANVTIDVNEADHAALTLGDEDDGYVSWVTLEDIEDDEVTLTFDTHDADGEPWAVHEDSEAEIDEDNTGVHAPEFDGDEDAFPVYNWDLSVGDGLTDEDVDDGYEVDDEYDRDRLVVEERTVPGDVDLHTAPGEDGVDDFDSFEDSTITQTNTIADEDALLLTVEDFGAEGLVAALDDDNLEDDGIVITITEEDAGPIGDAASWSTDADDEDSDDLEVSLINSDDYEGDLIFVIENADVLDTNEDYEVEFEVTEDNNYVEDEDDELSQDLDLSVVDREVNWNAIETLPADEDATANGTTTVAPGTELEANADSPNDEGGFVSYTDVLVEEGDDGAHVFDAEFDLAGEEVGVLFDLTVTDVAADGDQDEDTLSDVELTEAGEDVEESEGIDVDADAPTSVDVDDDATLDVTVTNHDDEDATTSYTVTINGDEVDSDELELDANGEFSDSYDLDTSAAGDVEWSVEIDDDSDSGTLTVEEEPKDDDGVSDDDGVDDDGVSEDDDSGADDDDSTPGFGVAVAVVALLAAAMLALRREN